MVPNLAETPYKEEHADITFLDFLKTFDHKSFAPRIIF